MINKNDLSDLKVSSDIWPLGKSSLPSRLFPDDHLYDIIFNYLPLSYNIGRTIIRRALKVHLKRNVPGYHLCGSELIDRDISLVSLFSNIPSSREHASELAFIVDQRRDGRRRRVPPFKPNQSFENIIWSSYEKKDEIKDLCEWIKDQAEKNNEYGPGIFHDSKTLLKAFSAGNCPVSLDDLWLSRSIVLFSALLPKENCLDLLVTAADQGCKPIRDIYFEINDSVCLDERNSGTSLPDVSMSQIDKLPKLSIAEEITYRVWEVSKEVQKQTAEILQADQDMRENCVSAENTLQTMRTSLFDCSDDKWIAFIEVIEKAREATARFRGFQAGCEEQCIEKFSKLLSYLKLPTSWLHPESKDNLEELVVKLRDIDAISYAIAEISPTETTVKNWRNDFTGTCTIEDLWNLVRHAEEEKIKNKNRDLFFMEVSDFCREKEINEIATFLSSLDAVELFSIIPYVNDSPWVPAGAILFSVAVDRENNLSSASLLSIMPNSRMKRRGFLRFIDPNCPIFRNAINFQRLIVVERLRDAWTFGPLAQISDLASGLGNVELMGRRVSDVIDLVVSNLDVLSSGADLVRMLRPLRRDEAQERLINFIHTPATLKGNFRRLREIARERLLLPLLAFEPLLADNVEKIITRIKSGQAVKDIVTEFFDGRPDNRIDARHYDQLQRYLSQASRFLNDFIEEATKEPDFRHKYFVDKLNKAYKELQSEGELGSIEWLESEIRLMLEGQGNIDDDQHTLIGNGAPILSRHWDLKDRDWASAFIDLPEFHGEAPLQPIEVAASMLRWKSRNLLPETADIVKYLVAQQNFSEALRVAEDADDHVAEEIVRQSCSTLIGELETRSDAILLEFRQHPDYTVPEREEFEASLVRLDIQEAQEILLLWQLVLKEEKDRAAAKIRDAAENERRESLLLLLGSAGLNCFDSTTSTTELAKTWQGLLKNRAQERVHLEVVSSIFQKCEAIQPDLVERIVRFTKDVTDPKLWLPTSLASELVIPVNAIALKISEWVMHSPNYRDEEQSAVIVLVGWFFDLVIERSVTFHEEENDGNLHAALDHLLDISVTITNANKPSECLARLADRGDMETFETDVVTHISYDNIEKSNIVSGRDSTQFAIYEILSDSAPSPKSLVEAVKNQDWLRAVAICDSAAEEANFEHATRLIEVKRAITPLMDYSLLPDRQTADLFPVSAAWLSSQSDGVSQLGDSIVADLAYRLLTGAIAIDSGQELTRSSGSDGMWTELLRANSPFRKMLTTSISASTSKVIEGLISGSKGFFFAEKLWEAATNLSEPQNYRAPLLSILNDNGAQDIIIKLAHRHDPAIVSRLSQLFELRAVAQNRPDLLPVAQSVAEQVAVQAKPGPFRVFVKGLPSAAQFSNPILHAVVDGAVHLRMENENETPLEISIVITPEGLVPTTILAHLLEEDDVSFENNNCVKILSDNPIYFASDYTVGLLFGSSWFGSDEVSRDSVRIRIQAKTVTNEIFQKDIICTVRPVDRNRGTLRRIDTDTLLDVYPGVSNTPVVDKAFIGRIDELERLQQVLVSAPNPSPVLLTGMRRIGKTSLLYAFHQRFSASNGGRAISVYQSLAERRVEFASQDHSVSWTFFKAISHGLVRPNVPAHDRNYALCKRIRERFGNDWKGARNAIFACYDEESLSDSLMVLADRLREWSGWDSRFIFLIDEAEALVAAYQAGGRKKLELEQLLQSLREVSQNTGGIGLLLSGSNHINMFAREYKNAFFGSSQTIELEGFSDPKTARQIIAPKRIENYIKFEDSAVSYAWELCAGMPQFLWQIGATTSFQIRSGVASHNDIRSAVAMLVSPNRTHLPFKPYEMLEPIDSMLSLEAPRERDLLWMLLYRVAQASSLAAPDAAVPVAIDQSLLAADDQTGWRRRLRTLVDLKALCMVSSSTVRFQVPLFAESFRAAKNLQEFNIRQQQVAL